MSQLKQPSTLSVRDLRRRWKPHKERLRDGGGDQPTSIRFHRACSWLARVEQLEDGVDADFALLAQWIAFNSLYGQWDEERREPKPDRESWRRFMDRILALDAESQLERLLQDHKKLVLSLLDDAYLSSRFWQDPSPEQAKRSRRRKFDAQAWYVERNWTLILDHTLERIYLLRCQLVHGAATYEGKLNRTEIRRCSTMLGHLLPAVMLVLIDHGADQDWGPMCYPPLNKRSV